MQSLNSANGNGNRFGQPNLLQPGSLSHPFVFDIDDAVLGTLIGPLVQILPQLMNAANQKRVQLKQADNKLVSDILSEVNRRMLLEQLAQARATPSLEQSAGAASINELIELLPQDSPAQVTGSVAGAAAPARPSPPATPPGSPAVAPSTVKSFSLASSEPAATPSKQSSRSSRPTRFRGIALRNFCFPKRTSIQLNVRLTVGDPVPKTSLPKAILKFTFKDGSDHSPLLEKTFKEKDLLPNSTRAFLFSLDDLSHLPLNRDIAVLAQMRWLGAATGLEHTALGSSEIVVVDRYFVKEQGKAVGPERELTDMKKFRPFWNKIWEAPLLDGKAGDDKKYLWELDANVKYSVLLSSPHESNGLMQTMLLRGPVDQESLTNRTEGRMKAGIELSMSELNKLLPLWDGETPLDAERLGALKSDEVTRTNAGELVYSLKFKGKASERGMIWVIPVFKLLSSPCMSLASRTNPVRLLLRPRRKCDFHCLFRRGSSGCDRNSRSRRMRVRMFSDEKDETDNDSSNENSPEYVFDGFAIDFSKKVALTSPAPAPDAGQKDKVKGDG